MSPTRMTDERIKKFDSYMTLGPADTHDLKVEARRARASEARLTAEMEERPTLAETQEFDAMLRNAQWDAKRLTEENEQQRRMLECHLDELSTLRARCEQPEEKWEQHRCIDDFNPRAAESEAKRLREALRQTEKALEHVMHRPHEHNPLGPFVPVDCEIITEAIEAARSVLLTERSGEK